VNKPQKRWICSFECQKSQKMKTIRVIILAAVLVLDLKVRADGLMDINFTGGGNLGHGQIDVENGYAVSGYFDVTAGLAAGNYTLYTAGGTGTYQSLLTSPSGKFIYDNAVYLTSNPQYPSTNPIWDNGGLLFTDINNSEVNVWGNADGSHTFDAFINNAYLDNTGVVGVSTITPTPEPSSLALIALMLVPAGVFFRHNRKAQSQP
jgi:hypothetical protein